MDVPDSGKDTPRIIGCEILDADLNRMEGVIE